MNTSYFFDIAFILIVIIMFALGKKRGAFKVVAGLFGTLIAWVGAMKLTPKFTSMMSNIITPYARKSVTGAAESLNLTSAIDSSVEVSQGLSNIGNAFSSLGEKLSAIGLPEGLSDIAEKLKITVGLESALPVTGGTVVDPYQLLTDALVDKISPILTFIALFILIKIAITLVTKLLSLDLPVIGTLNRLAGGLIGAIGGIIIVVVLCLGVFSFGSDEPYGPTSRPMLYESYIGGFVGNVFNVDVQAP